MQPCVLIVSNHAGVKDFQFAGVFTDRQVLSLKATGVHISTFDMGTSHSPIHLYRKWRSLLRVVHRLDPDIIHARYGTLVAAVSVLCGRPTVITFCGSDLLPGASVSLLRTYLGIFLSNVAALRARAIICVSEELRRALWWQRKRVFVVPDGVDLDLFTPGCQAEARNQLGWKDERPIVLFVGARDPWNKGLDLAEASMRLVRSQIPEAELHCVTNVAPAQMPYYYRGADVLLCASRQEGSPNVVKEALACNLPVVSVSVGDIPERLHGVHPSVVVSRCPAALARALVNILTSRERSNGRANVSNLGLHSVAQRVLAVYRSVLK